MSLNNAQLFPHACHRHQTDDMMPTKCLGVGDTFGTCFGPLSRNRRFGYRLGKGETPEEIRASMTEVAEGVDTSIALVKMIKKRCKGYRLDLKVSLIRYSLVIILSLSLSLTLDDTTIIL